MSINIIFVLMYHRHKLLDRIYENIYYQLGEFKFADISKIVQREKARYVVGSMEGIKECYR
jgi:hypothetical protein